MVQLLKELIYKFLKFFLSFGFAFTYRHIISSGYKKIKKNKPALFVANHQNTFMDGFMMVYTAGTSNPFILVRADIFKSKLAKIGLDTIKLMPIYRKRDGVNTKSQNDQIFEQCIKIFERKQVVALFPEGNHAFPRYLRPLQKGAARIAYQAETENNFNLNLSIIPLGLQYENHTDRWHDVYVHYTDALKVHDFKASFEKNEQATYKEITDLIGAGISSQMIDIKEHDDLLFYEQVRILMKDINKRKTSEAKSLVHIENKMIQKLSDHFKNSSEIKENIEKRLNELIVEINKLGINTNHSIQPKPRIFTYLRSLALALFSPFFLLFKIFSFIPEFIIEDKIVSKIKDKTWHLSIRFAVAGFLYPIFYGLIWIILSLAIDNIIASIIIFSIPLVNIIGLEWKHYFNEVRNQLILYRNKELNSKEALLIKEIMEIYS